MISAPINDLKHKLVVASYVTGDSQEFVQEAIPMLQKIVDCKGDN